MDKEEGIPQEEFDVEIKGVDVDAGLAKVEGSVRDYIDILEIFAQYGPDKVMEIENYAKDKDYDNYTIVVHSLQSVAANIGAHQLFTMAKVHEFAGKSKNFGFIDTNHDKLVALYREIIESIRKTLEEIKEKEQ